MSESRKDQLIEPLWGFAGAAIGFFPGTIVTVVTYLNSDEPALIQPGDLAQVIAFVISASVAVTLLLVSRGKAG